MKPMDIAMQLLKRQRQTTLGEFHPDLPSPHGPVTMRRWHPNRKWGENWLQDLQEGYGTSRDFNEETFQPYEKLNVEGLKPHAPTLSAAMWEHEKEQDKEQGIDTDVKTFDIHEGTKGNWFYPTGKMEDAITNNPINADSRGHIGVRIPIDRLKGQFRNKGFENEPAEAFVEDYIPPQYLVQLPLDYMGEGEPTWGERGV